MHLIQHVLSYILASLSMTSTRKATWPSIWWLTRSSRGWGIPWCCIPVSAPSGGACRHQSRPVSVINQTQISARSWCTTLLQYADVMFGPNNQNITSVQYLNMLQDARDVRSTSFTIHFLSMNNIKASSKVNWFI